MLLPLPSERYRATRRASLHGSAPAARPRATKGGNAAALAAAPPASTPAILARPPCRCTINSSGNRRSGNNRAVPASRPLGHLGHQLGQLRLDPFGRPLSQRPGPGGCCISHARAIRGDRLRAFPSNLHQTVAVQLQQAFDAGGFEDNFRAFRNAAYETFPARLCLRGRRRNQH